jgi:GNAT superfamily N-acetyltransferase
MIKIILTELPSKDDLKTISQGIKSYNQIHLPDEVVFEPDTRFAVLAKNEKGEVVGGIRANAYWNYCLIELLWLSDVVRGKGIGSQLMKQAEAFAIENGFEYIRTETVSFQAKPFYEKLGYTVYGELKDLPKGCTTYCLVKKL